MNKPEPREGFVELEPVAEPPPAPQEQAAPEPEATPPDTWPMVIKLVHKPVRKSLKESVHELTLREPTAADIMKAGGNPCRIEITELAHNQVIYNPVIDDLKMMRLMANLSGILEPFLAEMDTRDYNSCAYRLRKFFLPEQGIW